MIPAGGAAKHDATHAGIFLVMTLLLWRISWLVKRRYPSGADSGEVRRLRLLIRAAATFDVLYLVGWMALLTPVLSVRPWVYSRGCLISLNLNH